MRVEVGNLVRIGSSSELLLVRQLHALLESVNTPAPLNDFRRVACMQLNLAT